MVLLSRSAWAGSQRYGAALWSGDIGPTWASLRAQVRAGLNVGLSGIPWWTTDIGGFHGGDPKSADYRELIVRWFQYGVFCPLFRLHGFRDPRSSFGPDMTGGPNEVWSYGEEASEMIGQTLRLRERLRPYLMRQMRVAHETGLPPMRPAVRRLPRDAACLGDRRPVPARPRSARRAGPVPELPGQNGVPARRSGVDGRVDRDDPPGRRDDRRRGAAVADPRVPARGRGRSGQGGLTPAGQPVQVRVGEAQSPWSLPLPSPASPTIRLSTWAPVTSTSIGVAA